MIMSGNEARNRNARLTGSAHGVLCNVCIASVWTVADFDDCATTPCLNGGTCVDQIGYYTCTCPGGYTGAQCQTAVGPLSCLLVFLFIMPSRRGGEASDTAIRTSVCPSPRRAAALGYIHRRPPEI